MLLLCRNGTGNQRAT